MGFVQRGREVEKKRWFGRGRRKRWRMKGGMVGGWQRRRERVKRKASYFQMAWLSGDDTFTESSHRISHWLHLPALGCCSLVKAATDQWSGCEHTHRVHSFIFHCLTFWSQPDTSGQQQDSGYSTWSLYGFSHNGILRWFWVCLCNPEVLNQQLEGTQVKLPLYILLQLRFFPLNFIPTVLIHGDTLCSQHVPVGICRLLPGTHKNSIVRAWGIWVVRLVWTVWYKVLFVLWQPWELCTILLKWNSV